MLNTMRKNAGSWMIKVLLLAIVIVFVFWGVGSFRDDQGGRIALVNGYTISYDDYQKAYNIMMKNLEQRFGKNLNDDLLKMLNVKEEALNQLINNRLLSEEARRLNFDVTKEELTTAIKNIDAFQSNGSFDNRRYQFLLQNLRTTPAEFEASHKESMLIDKLRSFIENSVKVSDEEILEWYRWNNTSVDIEYTVFEPKAYQNFNPTEEDIKGYYEDHKTAYKTDPMVKVRYIHFKPNDYREKVTVTDSEVSDYFQENPEEYVIPKTIEVNHILLKLQPDEEPEVVEEKRKKAEEIMAMAKSGEDFAKLAQDYSEGPSKANGGYLGEYKKEDLVKPFADKAFSMQTGDISEPVRTQFGWHIIKVDKVNPESKKSFDEVKQDIHNQLIDKKVQSMAYNMAEDVYDESFQIEDLTQIADDRKLKLVTSDFFSREGPKTGVLDRKDFAEVAFGLEEMEISEVVSLDGGYYILQLLEKMPEKIQPLEDIEANVKKDLIRQLSEEAAQKEAEKMLAELKKQPNDTADPNSDKVFKATGLFKRYDPIPDIGNERDISEAAFLLSEDHPFPEKVLKGADGYYIIRFKERKAPDDSGLENEKTEIRKRLVSQKQIKTFNSLVTQLRSNSEISIKADFLN